MTGHASSHCDIALPRERIARCHRAVAAFTGSARFKMHAMTERDVARDLVNALPGDRLAGACQALQSLSGGLVLRDGNVAGHACGGGGKAHEFPRVGIGVALLASEARAGMLFVTERDRLAGRGRLSGDSGDGEREKRKSQRAPAEHSAAMITALHVLAVMYAVWTYRFSVGGLTYNEPVIRLRMKTEAQHDTVFQAIAHHTRREILTVLRDGPKAATDIVRSFSVSQPAISRQLKVLLDASLVTAKTTGRQRIYRLNTDRLGLVHEWVSRIIRDPSGHVWVLRQNRQAKKGS